MFPNLSAELKRKGISTKALAAVMGCCEKSALNKLNGDTEFTLSEVLAINEHLLPEFELRYLFRKLPEGA